jgi:hypothetical protein
MTTGSAEKPRTPLFQFLLSLQSLLLTNFSSGLSSFPDGQHQAGIWEELVRGGVETTYDKPQAGRDPGLFLDQTSSGRSGTFGTASSISRLSPFATLKQIFFDITIYTRQQGIP